MSNRSERLTVEVPRGVFNIFPKLCKGCGLCREKCPKDCLVWSDQLGSFGTPVVYPEDSESCSACGICAQVCPDCAIWIEKKKKEKS